MEGWQEEEIKDKVECVVNEACENGRIRTKGSREDRRRLD